MPHCTVCAHGELIAIQKDIATGVPLSELVARWGLAKSSLSRHAINHMGRTKRAYHRSGSRAAKVERELSRPAEPESDTLSDIREFWRAISLQARETGDYRLAERADSMRLKLLAAKEKEQPAQGEAANTYAHWPVEALEALQRFHATLDSGGSVDAACRAAKGDETGSQSANAT